MRAKEKELVDAVRMLEASGSGQRAMQMYQALMVSHVRPRLLRAQRALSQYVKAADAKGALVAIGTNCPIDDELAALGQQADEVARVADREIDEAMDGLLLKLGEIAAETP